LDAGFNPGAGINTKQIRFVAVQDDGKILIWGAFTNVLGLARLNPDGTVDAGFEAQLGGGSVDGFAPLPGGGLLVAATISNAYRVLRLLPSGQVDSAYSDTNGLDRRVNIIVPLSDGRALLGGQFTQIGGVGRAGVALLTADGHVDSKFVPDPKFKSGHNGINTAAVQTDGEYLLTGSIAWADQPEATRIVRLLPDGTLDTTFGLGGSVQARPLGGPLGIWRIQPLHSGGLLAAGSFSGFNDITRLCVARLKEDGSVDATFDAGAGLWSASPLYGAVVTSVAVVGNGKLVIGGAFTAHGDAARPGLARLNHDGTLDRSFVPALSTNWFSYQVHALSDGRLLVLEWEYLIMGGQQLVRLQSDGSLDNSFHCPQVDVMVERMTPLANGKIFIGGYDLRQVDSEGRENLARLNADGTLDRDCVPGVSFKSFYLQLAGDYWSSAFLDFHALHDGKVLVVMLVAGRSGQPPVLLIRLDTRGALDPGFNLVATGKSDPKANSSAARLITEQADGKLLLAGDFDLVNGVPRQGLARLNADGILDEAFHVVFSPADFLIISAMVLQPDGKIVLAGSFNTVQGIPRRGLARLLPDGALDQMFDPGPGFEASLSSGSWIGALALQEDGQLVAGGRFFGYDGFAADNIVRIFGGDQVRIAPPQILAGTLERAMDGLFQFLVAAPRNQTVTVQAASSLAPATWNPVWTNKAGSGPMRFTDRDAAAKSRRFYRAVSP
jgi:uncharacterized delta-60 repeat protein